MEPKQETGTVEMVSVEWLLNNIHHSVDGCNDDYEEIAWDYLIRCKCDYSLVRVIHTIWERGFRVPICLYPNPHGADWGLGNGHHRMAASILLCLDQIPVYWSDHDYMSNKHTDSEGTVEIDTDEANAMGLWLDKELRDLIIEKF